MFRSMRTNAGGELVFVKRRKGIAPASYCPMCWSFAVGHIRKRVVTRRQGLID